MTDELKKLYLKIVFASYNVNTAKVTFVERVLS